MKRKTLLSWSSGKDSAWALHLLQQQPDIELMGLFCTINQEFKRAAMHAVRIELIDLQAQYAGLPMHIIEIPNPCSNDEYKIRMSAFIAQSLSQEIECIAFGDLYLEDVRKYREDNLAGTGITPIFPVWGIPTQELSHKMIASGLRAKITCVDPKKLSPDFAGREYDESFLAELPDGVDSCGENGEFHSFAFAGPMFHKPLRVFVGEVVRRDGFVFADLKAEK